MFHFSDKFMKEYAPYTVELGRSFVSLDYQNVRKNSKRDLCTGTTSGMGLGSVNGCCTLNVNTSSVR